MTKFYLFIVLISLTVCLYPIDSFTYKDKAMERSWNWYDSSNRLPGNFVTCLEKGENGTLYIGTWKGLVIKKNDSWNLMDKESGLSDNKVTCLKYVSSSKKLYAGTISLRDRGGLNILSGNTIEIKTVNDGLPSNDIISVNYEEKSSTLYVGTWENGIGIYKDGKWLNKNIQNGFISNNILSISVDYLSRIWVGTKFDKGFSVLENGIWKIYNEHNSELCDNAVLDIEFSKNSVWFATWGGLNKMDFKENPDNFKKWSHYQNWDISTLKGKYSNIPYELPSDFVRTIYYDKASNSIWFGTDKGLSFYNFKDRWIIFTTNKKIVSIFDDKLSKWKIEIYPYSGIKSNQIFDVLVNGKNVVIATDSGVGILKFYNKEK